MKAIKSLLFSLAAGSSLLLTSCGKDEPVDPSLTPEGMNFGKITSAVVVVNPVINEGSSTTVPSGKSRSKISVQVGELDAVSTENNGRTLCFFPGKYFISSK